MYVLDHIQSTRLTPYPQSLFIVHLDLVRITDRITNCLRLECWTVRSLYRTVFESHDVVVGGPRSCSLSVVRLYVNTVQRVLVEAVKPTMQYSVIIIIIIIIMGGCRSWDGDVEVRRARVVTLVADVVTNQSAIVMQ